MIKKLFSVVFVLIFVFTFSACSDKTGDPVSSSAVSSEAAEEKAQTIKIGNGRVKNGVSSSETYGTVVEQLSLTPLTDAASFLVKDTKNYKWIAYNNYNLIMNFESGTMLSRGGYLFYIELPECSFSHEMYFEFFATADKVEEYSGEVAYTESDKLWYSLPLGANGWTEHTTKKYKLCFEDSGSAFKGYVFIPSDSLTLRYDAQTLSNVCVFVKSGIETGNGDTGNGIDFRISAVLPVDAFDQNTVIAESEFGRVDLSKNEIAE